jgi:hypothetical protein
MLGGSVAGAGCWTGWPRAASDKHLKILHIMELLGFFTDAKPM